MKHGLQLLTLAPLIGCTDLLIKALGIGLAGLLLIPLCALLRSVLLSALRPSPSSVTTPGRFFHPVFRHLFRRLLRRIPRYFFIWHISPLFCTYALKILTVSTASRTSWTRRIAAPWRRHSHPRATVPARDWAGVTPSTR